MSSMSRRLSAGNRTTTAKRRCPSMSVVATRPAMAVSMVSLTSPTAMPWRAAASRSMTTSYWVRPETCSTLTSVAPRTPDSAAPIRSAKPLSVLEVRAEDLHGQVALHAGDELVHPERDGLGEGEAEPREPGQLALHGLGQLGLGPRPTSRLRRGFSMTKTSVCSGPMGSSEISARPVLETTVSTSGNLRSVLSM